MASLARIAMFDKPQSVTFECREFMFRTTNRPSHPVGF
jgi:hypothetical protein